MTLNAIEDEVRALAFRRSEADPVGVIEAERVSRRLREHRERLEALADRWDDEARRGTPSASAARWDCIHDLRQLIGGSE